MSHAGNEEVNHGTSRKEPINESSNFDLSKIDGFLREIAKKWGIASPSFHFAKGCKVGDNFMGICYRAEIVGKNKDGHDDKIPCFLKCVPMDTFHREVLQVRKIFLRESYFYEELLPTFNDLVGKRMDCFKYAPRFYGSYYTPGAEVLVLEDLNCHGFEMKKSRILDLQHVSLALRRLGEFHAYSFAMREKNPNKFETFKRLEEPFFAGDDASENPIHSHSSALFKLSIRCFSKEEKHYTEKLQNFLQSFYAHMKDATNGNAAEPYAVVNHGDAWTNNMLFKYKKDANGLSVPYDHRFLDFQQYRYASPVLDIVYMIFCCCSQELRSRYFDQLLREYHQSLSERLVDLSCDPVVLFPFEALTEQLKRFGKYAIGMAIYLIPVLTDTNDEEIDIQKRIGAEYLEKRMEEDHLFRNMLRDSIKDAIDRKYF